MKSGNKRMPSRHRAHFRDVFLLNITTGALLGLVYGVLFCLKTKPPLALKVLVSISFPIVGGVGIVFAMMALAGVAIGLDWLQELWAQRRRGKKLP